jgi:hypothetical protein
MIAHEELKELLDYDPLTGIFTWKRTANDKIRGKAKIGEPAGTQDKSRYVRITIGQRTYYAHRLAWFYMKGEWPHKIDHRDLDSTNNRFLNLREASQSQNNANVRGRGRHGKGVRKRGQKFWAGVTCRGEHHYLGIFDTKEEAAIAYSIKARELFGDFARSS